MQVTVILLRNGGPMSRSYRTSNVGHLADRRIARDRSGSISYPRVIVRKPAPGDIHPFAARSLNFQVAVSGSLLRCISRCGTLIFAQVENLGIVIVNFFEICIDQPDGCIFRGLFTHI